MYFRVCAAGAILLGAGFGSWTLASAAEMTINSPLVDARVVTGATVNIAEGTLSATNGISVFPRLGAVPLNAPAPLADGLTRSDTAALRREFPLMEGGGDSLRDIAVSVREDRGNHAVGDGAAVNEWTGMLDGLPTAFTPPSQDGQGTPMDSWVTILD